MCQLSVEKYLVKQKAIQNDRSIHLLKDSILLAMTVFFNTACLANENKDKSPLLHCNKKCNLQN
jgi:hypothetical protein